MGMCTFNTGQRKIAVFHFCRCTNCFAVVPCILQLCFFCRSAKIMYYSYVKFCWCANEIAVVLFILQECIQFVSSELFLLLYYIFPCLPTKKIETLTHAIWDTGSYNFVFVPENHQDTIQDSRLIQIHFHDI